MIFNFDMKLPKILLFPERFITYNVNKRIATHRAIFAGLMHPPSDAYDVSLYVGYKVTATFIQKSRPMTSDTENTANTAIIHFFHGTIASRNIGSTTSTDLWNPDASSIAATNTTYCFLCNSFIDQSAIASAR